MKRRTILIGSIIAAVACLFFVVVLNREEATVPALPESHVLKSFFLDGSEYKLADDGIAYRVVSSGSRWSFVDRLFEPEEVQQNYRVETDKVVRVAKETGKTYPVTKRFAEGFEELPEGVAGLRELIGEKRLWTELVLQSPKSPSVKSYVALRQKILNQGGDFLDARVEPTTERAASGTQSLRCFSPAKSEDMICSKSSMAMGLIYFEHGDDVWYRATYFVEGKRLPFTLVDLECDYVKESPGIRLMLFGEGYLGAELKAFDKPKYRQAEGKMKRFPTDRWVQVVWNVLLRDDETGRVRIWQDGELVVDGNGPTLPFKSMIYNRMEVGISAHSFGNEPAVLYVDDIEISDQPSELNSAGELKQADPL